MWLDYLPAIRYEVVNISTKFLSMSATPKDFRDVALYFCSLVKCLGERMSCTFSFCVAELNFMWFDRDVLQHICWNVNEICETSLKCRRLIYIWLWHIVVFVILFVADLCVRVCERVVFWYFVYSSRSVIISHLLILSIQQLVQSINQSYSLSTPCPHFSFDLYLENQTWWIDWDFLVVCEV